MIDITVKPSFESLGRAFKLIQLGAALQRGIEKLAFSIEREAKIETPVDTGRLRSSINTSVGTLQARIAPHVVYAGWIHDGKMTRLGRSVFLKGLGRAGTPPGGKAFMQLGVDKSLRKFGTEQNDIVNEISVEIERNLPR